MSMRLAIFRRLMIAFFVALSVFLSTLINAQGEARVRVLHLVPDAPEFLVQIDGEPLSMGMMFGPASYLWNLGTMTTSTLNLPHPSGVVDSLPVGGVSPYGYVTSGEHTITLIDKESAESLAEITYRFPLEGAFSVLVTGTPDALTMQVVDERYPLLEFPPSDIRSVYTVVNNLSTVGSLEFRVDDEVILTNLAYGEMEAIAINADEHEHIALYADDALLYEEALPTKTLLPDVIYTLAAVSMDGKEGVILHATYNHGIASQTADDLVIGMDALEVTIGGEGTSSGIVERSHFFTLDAETTIMLIAEALPDSPLDPHLRIVDVMSGALIAVNDDLNPDASLTAGFENLTIPAGNYVVSVSGYAYSTIGAYQITFEESE